MTALLMSLAMTLGADSPLEGKWLIVYAEEGSRRNTTWEQRVATLKDDKLSYSKDGEDRSVTVKFGDHQSVKGTLVVGKEEGKALSGVAIIGQDYLCLSMNADKAKASDDPKASSGSFILILRRQR